MSRAPFPPALGELAEAHGVATGYRDADGHDVAVAPDVVRVALAAMAVDAADERAAAESLAAHQQALRARLVPPSHVARRGVPDTYRLPAGDVDQAVLTLEGGATRELTPHGQLTLPDDLPVGYHRLWAARAGHQSQGTVIVAPPRCPVPSQRLWGWMTQLYQLRSATSWGLGDARDLRTLAERSTRELGAGFVVCNPLHAVAPVTPVEPSPYFPSSRRFVNPLYIHVEDVPEVAGLPPEQRARLDELAREAGALNAADRIDYDAILRCKQEALALVHRVPRDAAREADLAAFRGRQGRGLVDFATFCALAEVHGVPWTDWPEELRHPDHPAVARARADLADRVDRYAWQQWVADAQLACAHEAAAASGMALGCIHDLAVGVDPGGADAWALQEELATGVSVGAPPDAFNQLGQDWRQPPLRPDRLVETGFGALRDLLRSVLAHAGGVRIDHVLGLFRLYWIPRGATAAEGTYVSYPAEELLATLAVESDRAEAIVVGEDLGTVAEGARERLWDWGVLGSRVLYFESDDTGARRPADAYPELALASVNTHDLPTAAGWWRDEALRVQAEFGLLAEGRSAAEQQREAAAARADMVALLRREGCIGDDPDPDELLRGMYAFLAKTPARLLAASPADAVGDVRQPNLPGTVDEYPNWRLPLSRPEPSGHRPVSLEELLADPGTRALADLLRRR